MAAELSLWGPITADTTKETVFTNVTGTIAVLEGMTVANPASGTATNIILSYGTDGATTRALVYPVPAGAFYAFIPIGWRITGVTVLELSSSSTDDVVVTMGFGYRVAA